MNIQPSGSPLPASQPQPGTKMSLVLRLAFYIGAGLIGLQIVPLLLMPVFGMVVSATLGLFLIALLANIFTMRIFDRRPITDIGLYSNPGSGTNFIWGLLLGACGAAVMLSAPLLARTGHFVPRPSGAFAWSSLLFYVVALLFGAAGEEILFRGYAFQLLIQRMGPWATVLPAGVLFGFAHTGNPGASFLALLNTIAWGILLGYAFLRSRDLWLPIGLHYGWNAVLPLFGVNLSGLTIEVTRYSYQWDLSPLWSGGAYGPEGGALTTIFIVVLFFLLHRIPIVPQTARIAVCLNES